jgi:methionine-rich copper-binding protein CopC
MKKSLLALFLIPALLSGAALAHSPVKATSPANDAVLEAAPEAVTMTFAAPARVMKVSVTHTTKDGSEERKVQVPTRDMLTEIELEPEFSGPGNYKVNWRALGEDGHVLKGSFAFEIAGD